MSRYYLAIDIGASSGRHILGHMEGNRLVLEQIYRFENHMDEKEGSLIWDTGRLFSEILEGMIICKTEGKIPYSMGIDTWGVDYGLLDEEGRLVDKVYAYRDHRTDSIDRKLESVVSADVLYEHTGIQKQNFNTIYQLYDDMLNRSDVYNKAQHMLLLPDLFDYMLTGRISTEYTNATTTGLVDAKACDWDSKLIECLGFNSRLFTRIVNPGTCIGNLKREIAEKVGYDTKVIKVASHDTGSAVAALPTDKETVFISSGTWSLLGTERRECDCSQEARKENFTNEGGVEHRYRFLKNIMGMWMIQSVRHEYNDEYDFAKIAKLAAAHDRKSGEKLPGKVIDVNDSRFLSPKSMRAAIDEVCRECDIEPPCDIGGYASLIYRSLADYYRRTIEGLEQITGKIYDTINIVGGGSKAEYLNSLIEKVTGRKVFVGPTEATAVGNLFVQLISDGVCKDITQARTKIEIEE